MSDPASVTCDALFGGAVRLFQPASGYRVNNDPVLLASFAAPRDRAPVLDLGAGVGAVALALNHLYGCRNATLCEREPEFAALAEKNVALAGMDAKIVLTDLEQAGLPSELHGSFELVVSNPPFFEPNGGQPARNGLARRARSGPLEPFLSAAQRALAGKKGRACFAYPARSLEHLLRVAARRGLVAKRLRLVHPSPEQPARLCLVELRLAKLGGLTVEPPLYEWDAQGVRSAELGSLQSAAPAVPAQSDSPNKRSKLIAAAARTLK